MNKRAIGSLVLVVGCLGMGFGYMAAQQQYSSTVNQLGSLFGAGQTMSSLLFGSPVFLAGAVASLVGLALLLFG